MKSTIIAILFFVVGCASGITGLMRLQDRELLIHPDKPGLAYPHIETVCEKRKKPWTWLGLNCRDKHVIDFYDFNKKADRDKLINAAFTCKSKARFQY